MGVDMGMCAPAGVVRLYAPFACRRSVRPSAVPPPWGQVSTIPCPPLASPCRSHSPSSTAITHLPLVSHLSTFSSRHLCPVSTPPPNNEPHTYALDNDLGQDAVSC